MPWGKTKKEIFNQSLELFSERGYCVVTVREIAAAAGVGPAAIYSHFKSKEDILNEIFNAFEEEVKSYFVTKEQLEEHIETDTPFQLLDRFLSDFTNNEAFIKKAYRIACMEQMTNPRARDLIIGLLHTESAKSIQRILDHLIKHGKIPAFDTKPFSVIWAQSLFSEATAFISLSKEEQAAKTFNEQGDFLREMAISGKIPCSKG